MQRSTFKVLFYVKRQSEKSGQVPVMGRITINGTISQFSCKLTVRSSLWDAKANKDTDPNHLRVQDPGKVEGNPVFIYLDAFSRPEHFAEFLPEYQNLDELKAHYQRGGLGDVKVKKFLNSVMQAELEPIRNRRKEWEQRLPEVVEILKEGSAVAEKTAAATLAEVRKSMKIDYFTDDNLLK